MPRASVVVVGGHGFFGRLVVDDLLASTTAHVLVAGRIPRLQAGWDPSRVTLVSLDQHEGTAVRRAIEGTAAVVHAAGPYQGLEPSVLRAALETGVPYVDLADDRSFVQQAEELVTASSRPTPPVLLGMSFVPGLCALLVAHVREGLGVVDRIRCIAAPGSRGSRGTATLDSLLSHAGRRFDVPRRNGPQSAWGWSNPEPVAFPPPIGKRIAYLAIPVADFDLFPRWFGCPDVEFRACSDQPTLDRVLWMMAGVQRLVPIPFLRRSGRIMARLVRVAGDFGTDAGAGLVELSSEARFVRVAVVAPQKGERLPALPAALAAAEILSGRLDGMHGLVPPHHAIHPAAMVAGLAARGITTWVDRGDGWKPIGES